MSCQLAVLSKFQDISSVKQFLFPHLKESTPDSDVEQSDAGDWDNWNWGTEEQPEAQPQEAVEKKDNYHKWLQDSIVSLSPTNDLIALAVEDRIVILAQKWEKQNADDEMDTKYTTTWQTSLKQEEGETITALLCVPLASQKRSTQGGPDWTCVIVGFSTGYVRMYTESGVLLLSQLLHAEPVGKIKCKTYQPGRFLGIAEIHEELIILFRRTLVSIDGFSLVQSLRACRNQVARVSAGGEALQPPPLAYKKWSLGDQEKVEDTISCGLQSTNAFDHMKTASLLGGFRAQVKVSPPAASVFLTSGMGPYVGIFYAMEGSAQPILSEVAMAMAHKIKSALISAASGWLGFGGRQKDDAKDKQPPKIEPAVPLPLRYGFHDKRRNGESIALSPSGNYAATTDSFGRVLLIDLERGIAVRMWKGYRDAQVGWVQVREEDNQGGSRESLRIAQFLIIYAPRRGILEVWLAAHGPRVAAFNVSRWCWLVCPGFGMMGLNNVTCRGVKVWNFQCALVDPVGVIKTVDVPFHLALSDKSSKRARDLHILKKLKAALKETSEESEGLKSTITSYIQDMRIASIAQQGMERVLNTKYLSAGFMADVIKACIAKLASQGEDKLDIDGRLFLQFCQAQAGLLATYAHISALQPKTDTESSSKTDTESSSKADGDSAATTLAEMLKHTLNISEAEAESLESQMRGYCQAVVAKTDRVHFAVSERALGVTSYLHCFDCKLHCQGADQDSTRCAAISVRKNISEDRKAALSKFVFERCLRGEAASRVSAHDLGVILQDTGFPAEQIMNLLLTFWLSEENNDLTAVPQLHRLVKSITSTADRNQVAVDHNSVSPWWQLVRDACSHSQHNGAALILGFVARSVAQELNGNQTQAKDPDADTASSGSDRLDLSEWESLSVDVEAWNLLLRRLEDALSLGMLLHLPPPPRPPHLGDSASPISVSVSQLLERGRGSVSDVVARHLTNLGLEPQHLYRPEALEASAEGEEGKVKATEKPEVSKDPLHRLQDQLAVMRERFPHSLENDVLLANCCWENAVLWKTDVENIFYLELSLEYLKLVQNAVLRQGLASMMWHMHIVKRFQAAVQLVEKVGKAPKERLCRKEIGMNDAKATIFLGLICDMLQVTMDANCEANELPVSKVEPLWQGEHGPGSLVELAIDQKATNYGLLKHHQHLARITHAVLVFSLRQSKPLSLFDLRGRNAFFKDLHSHPLLPSHNVDMELSLARREFLCKLISQAILAMERAKESSSPNVEYLHGESTLAVQRYRNIALRWIYHCLHMAEDFGLDADYLRQHAVVELYSGGNDKMAEETMMAVQDHETLGSHLLLLAGRRLAFSLLTRDTAEVVQVIAAMSPQVSNWLRSMDFKKLRKQDTPLAETVVLLGHAVSNLPEGSADYELAVALVDLVQTVGQ